MRSAACLYPRDVASVGKHSNDGAMMPAPQNRLPVIFDLDGTLVDSAPDIHASVNATLREARLRTLPLDRVH